MDTLFNILHVASAVFIIGPIAIMPMTSLRYLRTGDTARAVASAKGIRLLSYLSLLVVVTGFGAMSLADADENFSITSGWIVASIILYVIALALTLAVVVPSLQKATQGANPVYARAAASSGIATLCLVVVVVLMVWRP